MAGKYAFLIAGLLIGAGGVVGVTDIGPVKLDVQTNEELGEKLSETTESQERGAATAEPDAKAASQTEAEGGDESKLDKQELEMSLHDEINEERYQENLSQLQYDSGLQEIARYHSGQMAEYDFFAHESPSGETMGERYGRFGYSCRVMDESQGGYVTGGENIWKVTYTSGVIQDSESTLAAMAVSDWMDSPGHRENIVFPYWESEGIGVAVRDKPASTTVIITQNFC
jgi:uncharacterized protein YkwD